MAGGTTGRGRTRLRAPSAISAASDRVDEWSRKPGDDPEAGDKSKRLSKSTVVAAPNSARGAAKKRIGWSVHAQSVCGKALFEIAPRNPEYPSPLLTHFLSIIVNRGTGNSTFWTR